MINEVFDDSTEDRRRSNLIRNLLLGVFNNIELKMKHLVYDAVDNKIKTEEFTDSIVEKINRKQLKK